MNDSKRQIVINTILWLLSSFGAFGQVQREVSEKKVQVDGKLGIRWQSTLMNLMDFGPVLGSVFVPYNYEKNVQGLGISAGIRIFFLNSGVGLEYAPTFRYDYLYHHFPSNSLPDTIPRSHTPLKATYGLIIDNHFSIFKKLKSRNRKGLGRLKPEYVGIGFNLTNTGKNFIPENSIFSQTNIRLNLQFPSATVYAQIPLVSIKDTYPIYLEPKVHYLYRGFRMSDPRKRQLMFNLSVISYFKMK